MVELTRPLFLLVGLVVWTGYMLLQILRDHPVDVAIWGVPTAMWFALHKSKSSKKKCEDEEE